jgi:MFS family permease
MEWYDSAVRRGSIFHTVFITSHWRGRSRVEPPSHAIIVDLYPKEQRATAMAIFGTGIN